MATPAGETIMGYRLLERLGSGGFGVVYRAYQSTVGREVAVKVILPRFANSPHFIRRFEVEAQLIARMEHLHIVPLYDYWRAPDGAYLVMRWLRGGSLQQALQEGPFDLRPAVLLVSQIASALAAAHSQGVIHCDLKPSNVLLDEEGNAYLADFGIASLLQYPERGEAAHASLDFLSPEQARGEPATPQTDIYSLGVLLYETLTGRHPFRETTDVQRLYRRLNEPLPRLEGLDDAGQDGVNQVIQKATAKNPKHRYQSALEMAAALRAAADIDGGPAVTAQALTSREADILRRIAAGLSNKEIAQELFVEVTTIKWYLTQLYRKLGVRSRRQAVVRAQEAGLLADAAESEAGAAPAGAALPGPVNPYKGLRAFDVSDARDFFGREGVIEKLIARLRAGAASGRAPPAEVSPGAGRFLAVVGPSGSGKSSLVKAGLIPAIRRGAAPGSDQWFIVQFAPGKRPLEQLEVALTRVAADQSANLRQHLARDQYGLLRVADLILPQNECELLVVVDQFEEVFTLVEDEARRAHFLALLATAAVEPQSRVRSVLTLRADYYDRPLHHPQFGELLRSHMETILPLSVGELERAILRPAQQAGVDFEPGLAAQIIDDVQYQPGALPLLQFALAELFDRRRERTLTHAAYQAIGGAAGALARRAEALYQEQDAEGREAIRQMHLRLAGVDNGAAVSPDIRRRTPRSELRALIADQDLMDELIEAYVAHRLLTLDHDPDTRRPTVEVAHEALLREWGRLRAWLEASQADLRWQRQLTRAAEEWRRSREDHSFLLRGTRLRQFETWSNGTELALTDLEQAFLRASAALRDERAAAEAARQAREAGLERRARRVLRALAAVFLLAAVVSSWFAWDANRHRRAAERNFARSESQRLAAEATNILQRGGSAELASLLALHALRIHHTPQADLALQRAAARDIAPALIAAPNGAFWPFVSAAPHKHYLRFSHEVPIPYGRVVTTEWWDIQARERLWQAEGYVMYEYPWTIRDLTADHSMVLAMTSDQEQLVLLDVNSGAPVRTLKGNNSKIQHYQLSADAGVVVAGAQSGDIHVWDMETGAEVQRFAVGGNEVRSAGPLQDLFVAVSPDNRLAAARAAGLTHVWDLESGAQLFQFEHGPAGLLPPQFVAGGRLLAAVLEPTLSLWDLAGGRQVGHDFPPGGEGVLNPDGTLYALGWLGEASTEIGLWDVRTGRELHRLTGHLTAAVPLKFTNDGRRLVTLGFTEGAVRLWDVASGTELSLLAGHTQSLTGAALSPDERFLVTAGRDGAVRAWDLQALARGAFQLEGVRLALYHSPAGRVILTEDAEQAGAVLLDAGSMAPLRRLGFRLDAFGEGAIPAAPPFSGDGRLVLGITDSFTIRVYEVHSGALIGEYANPDDAFRSAAFVPGSWRIFAGGDRGAYLLDAETGERLRRFTVPNIGAPEHGSGFVAVSPDGRYGAIQLWTTGFMNLVALWDLETGAPKFQSPPQHLNTIASMAFSDDGRRFAWGDIGGLAHVIDLDTGAEVARLAHTNTVLGIDFSSGGASLLTASLGDSVTIWDLAGGGVTRRFFTGAGPSGFVRFVEDDEFILYATIEDGAVHRQPARLDGLLQSVCAGARRDLTLLERQTYGLDAAPACPQFAGS